MSDFDREAERERLREKYDRDREKRQTTQRMSELLLQGATMTNKHCESCGNPLFRHDETEFCPTCQSESGDTEAESERATAAEGADAEATADAEAMADAARNVDTDPTTNAARNDDGPSTANATPSRNTTPSTPAKGRTAHADGTAATPPADADASPQSRGDGTTAAPLADARDSLVEALSAHARAGTATDDPRRARDHLAAAREAAEALGALGDATSGR